MLLNSCDQAAARQQQKKEEEAKAIKGPYRIVTLQEIKEQGITVEPDIHDPDEDDDFDMDFEENEEDSAQARLLGHAEQIEGGEIF